MELHGTRIVPVVMLCSEYDDDLIQDGTKEIKVNQSVQMNDGNQMIVYEENRQI